MNASALYLVPHARRPLQHAGSIGFGVGGLVMLAAGVAAVGVPVIIASNMGASTVVMVAVGIGAFVFLAPVAFVLAGVLLDALS